MAARNKTSAIKNPPKHLLGIQNLSVQEAKQILKEAKEFINLNRSPSKKLNITNNSIIGKQKNNIINDKSLSNKSFGNGTLIGDCIEKMFLNRSLISFVGGLYGKASFGSSLII